MNNENNLYKDKKMDSGKMKKLRLFPGAALCLALTLGMTVPAMADSGSWQQDNEGRWKYITESGTAAAPGWLERTGTGRRAGSVRAMPVIIWMNRALWPPDGKRWTANTIISAITAQCRTVL